MSKKMRTGLTSEVGPTLITSDALGSDSVVHASIDLDGHSTEAARSAPPGRASSGWRLAKRLARARAYNPVTRAGRGRWLAASTQGGEGRVRRACRCFAKRGADT